MHAGRYAGMVFTRIVEGVRRWVLLQMGEASLPGVFDGMDWELCWEAATISSGKK